MIVIIILIIIIKFEIIINYLLEIIRQNLKYRTGEQLVVKTPNSNIFNSNRNEISDNFFSNPEPVPLRFIHQF